MLYILYLPKVKDERVEERKVNGILKWYTAMTRHRYSVIAAPGYLSSSKSSIISYLDELQKIIANGPNTTKIGFLNGMNGHYNVRGTNWSIIDKHNDELPYHNFAQIGLNPKREFDHRKMMCFFEGGVGVPTSIELHEVDSFIKDIHVGAILLGSSNQSRTSYFEKFASKGEADVFLLDAVDDTEIDNFINSIRYGMDESEYSNLVQWKELFDDIVVAESFYGKGHNYTQEFLKDILRDVLKSGLEW